MLEKEISPIFDAIEDIPATSRRHALGDTQCLHIQGDESRMAGDTRKESRRQHLKSDQFGQPRFHQGE